MATRRSHRLTLAAIVLAALALRLGIVVASYDRPPGPFDDDGTYAVIASNLVEGRGYFIEQWGTPWRAFRPPLFVLYLAAVSLAAGPGSHGAARAGLAVIGTLLVPLVFRLGRSLFGVRTALLAALAAALFPPFVHYSTHLQVEMIYIVLLTSAVGLLLTASAREGVPARRLTGRVLLAGALFGGACLTRSMIFGFFPFVMLWFAVDRGWRRAPALFGLFLLGAAAVLSPWWVRNYAVFGRFVPLSTEGGFTFYVGNNPLSTGGGECYIPPLDDVPEGTSELAMDRIFYARGMAFVKGHPGEFLRLMKIKVSNLWRLFPHVGGRALRTGSALAYTVLFALTALGAAASWERRRQWALLYLLVLYYTAVHSVFPALMRYRLPLEPFFLVLAASVVTGEALARREGGGKTGGGG